MGNATAHVRRNCIYEKTGGKGTEVGRQIGHHRTAKHKESQEATGVQIQAQEATEGKIPAWEAPNPTQKAIFQPRRSQQARIQPKTTQNGQDAPEAAKSAEGYIAKQNRPKGTSLRKRRFWFSLTPKG